MQEESQRANHLSSVAMSDQRRTAEFTPKRLHHLAKDVNHLIDAQGSRALYKHDPETITRALANMLVTIAKQVQGASISKDKDLLADALANTMYNTVFFLTLLDLPTEELWSRVNDNHLRINLEQKLGAITPGQPSDKEVQ